MDKILYIIRGAPGCGKSTVAKTLGVVCEADDYFAINGTYSFNKDKIKDAHIWCKNKAEKLMLEKTPKVVISNTNSEEWEFKPYEELAIKYGYQVFHLIVENRHQGSNIHNCPPEKVQKFRNRIMRSIRL